VALLGFPAWAEEAAGAQSLSEVNKQLSNPVSSLWSLQFQQNNFVLDPGPGEADRWSSNLLFQPVLPLAISDDWNLITRPILPLFVSTPRPDPEPGDLANISRSTAFGDIVLLQLISPGPELVGSWLLGAGPTWTFPTAGSDFTGQGKTQVGPAALVGYLSEKWIAGALYQQWWSFRGSELREDTATLNIQPIAAYFLPDGWSVGYSGNVLANFENHRGSDWTLPLGLGVNKVQRIGKLPVKFGLAVQWMPVQPDLYGQEWNVQLSITPVIPKLVRGSFVDPGQLGFGLPPPPNQQLGRPRRRPSAQPARERRRPGPGSPPTRAPVPLCGTSAGTHAPARHDPGSRRHSGDPRSTRSAQPCATHGCSDERLRRAAEGASALGVGSSCPGRASGRCNPLESPSHAPREAARRGARCWRGAEHGRSGRHPEGPRRERCPRRGLHRDAAVRAGEDARGRAGTRRAPVAARRARGRRRPCGAAGRSCSRSAPPSR
jgi:hypothetical protein